jgi:hypothetical protein
LTTTLAPIDKQPTLAKAHVFESQPKHLATTQPTSNIAWIIALSRSVRIAETSASTSAGESTLGNVFTLRTNGTP